MDKKFFGQIKLGLIQRGLANPTFLHGLFEVSQGLYSAEPGQEITLALADDLIVKATLNPSGKEGPKLISQEDRLRILMEEGETDVSIIPVPEFLKQQLKRRTPVSENICLDGYCFIVFLRAIGKV